METKRLYRSRTNRVITGVCGGIGEYLNIDPSIVRLLMVLLGFPFHGLIIYLVASLIIPERPFQDNEYSHSYQ